MWQLKLSYNLQNREISTTSTNGYASDGISWMSNAKEGSKYLYPGNDPLDLSWWGDRKGGAGNNKSVSISKLKSVKLVLTLEARWSWNYFSLSLFPLVGHHVLNLHNTIIMLLEGNFNELFSPKLHSILIEVIKVANRFMCIRASESKILNGLLFSRLPAKYHGFETINQNF